MNRAVLEDRPRRRCWPLVVISSLVLGVLSGNAGAQCEWVDVAPSPGDLAFGASLDVDGAQVFVGAPGDGGTPGAVYVFEVEGQNAFLEARLTRSSPLSGVEFGAAVDGESGTLFVGAPDEDLAGSITGAVFVFQEIGGVWTHVQDLLPSDLPSLAEFGRSLAFDGQRLVVGARFDSTSQPLAGSAYVFEDVGGVWTETAKLTAQAPIEEQEFGTAVAINDEWVFCGAPGDDTNGAGAGACFVFERQGSAWVASQKLVGSDTDDNDRFGEAVAAVDDVIVIGSPREESSAAEPDTGAAYCFDLAGTTWNQCQLIFSLNSETGDRFGSSLALRGQGDRLVVGSPLSDEDGFAGGLAYAFELVGGQYTEAGPLRPLANLVGSADGEQHGIAVAVEGDIAVVGAALGDPLDAAAANGAPGAGISVLYSLDELVCSTFSSDGVDLSVSGGGTRDLTVAPGPIFTGTIYVVAGSVTGRDPAFSVLGARVPLVPDTYLIQTLTAPFPPLSGSFGVLGPGGTATATLGLPPGSDVSLVGLEVWHAFVVLDNGIAHVSRPVGTYLGT